MVSYSFVFSCCRDSGHDRRGWGREFRRHDPIANKCVCTCLKLFSMVLFKLFFKVVGSFKFSYPRKGPEVCVLRFQEEKALARHTRQHTESFETLVG